MANTFRLYGPAVGQATVVVDADVDGVSTDGSIKLVPHDGSEAFSLQSETLRELSEEGLVYDKESVDESHPIWAAIEDVEARYESAPDKGEAFRQAARCLFKGAA